MAGKNVRGLKGASGLGYKSNSAIKGTHPSERNPKRGSSFKERHSERLDEVRSNIPKEHQALFDRVKGGLKATSRKSMTESFQHFVHENPNAVHEAAQARADRKLAQMVKQRSGRGPSVAKAPRQPKRKYTAAELASVPF